MSTVGQMAWADFKRNKGKNILTGIAIILTTLLLFVIPTVGFGQMDVQKAAVNEIYPTFHGMYRDVDEETVGVLQHRAEVEVLGLRQDVARIPSGDDLSAMIYVDQTAQGLSKTTLETGYFPEQRNEVAVSEGFLETLGVTAGLGDTIQIPFQVEESGSLGYEEREDFTITGILPTSKEQREANTYFVLVSRAFMEEKQPEDVRRYRVMFRIAGADDLTSDGIERVFHDMAADLGIPEGNVVANSDYMWANYVDPAFYTGVVIILLTVVLAGIMTICSIYYISTIYKVQEYGKIKALGATKRQIRQIVFREGMLAAAIAIPIGLILGTVISKAGFLYLTATYVEDDLLMKVTAQVISQGKVSLWKPWIYVLAIVVTLLAMAVSLIRPMQIASRISPVEAMRYDGDLKIRQKKRKGRRDMSLAALTGANLMRNKKRTFLTVVTLSLTGILFIVLSTVLSCADPEEIARDAMFDDLLLSADSRSGDKMHPEQEWTAICKDNPLDPELEKKIQGIPGVKKITKSSMLQTHLKDLMDGDAFWSADIIGIPEDYAARMEKSIVEGAVTYEELCQGDKILMDKNMLRWAPDWKVGDTLDMILECGDGPVERSFKIAAIADMPVGLSHYSSFVLPKQVVDGLGGMPMDYYWSVDVDESQAENAQKQIRTLLEEREFLEMETYEEKVALNKKQTGLTAQICYVFMAVLGGIGIMNLVNTLLNSIYVRRRELGILQAIGLSEKQMVRMLQLEGAFYTAGTLGLSLCVGSLAGYLMFLYARKDGILGIVSYHYPVGQAVCLVAVVFVIQLLLTYLVIRVFRRQSMIERIRFAD